MTSDLVDYHDFSYIFQVFLLISAKHLDIWLTVISDVLSLRTLTKVQQWGVLGYRDT